MTRQTTPHRKSVFFSAVLTCGLVAGLINAVQAANIAPLGTGILGVNNEIDTDAGTPRFNAGVAGNINDDDLSTRVDNWFGNGPTDQGQSISFVGIQWPGLRYDNITTLRLTLATFLDGGWFGRKSIGPAAGGPLTATHLIEPVVQISQDGGVTWATVPHRSDYFTALLGHGIGGGENPNPTMVTVTFTLQTAVTQVSGIRIIGENGGAADGNGFIGVFELEVEADFSADTDGDEMPDSWERANGLNVGTNDASGDPDADELTNLEEFNASTDPKAADSDSDGLNDGAEVKTHQTNPLVADTDGDGLSDGVEVNQSKTNPLAVDTDEDGLSDGLEVTTLRTNPLEADTDGDGFSDSLEVSQGSDPLNPSSTPTNLALFGHGLMGTKDSLESGPETEIEYYHVGTGENINDGNLTTRVDTWNSDTPGNVSFVGILWDAPVTSRIVRLEITLATFFDGGWFGVNGLGPAAGGKLAATHLAEPRVEVSGDGGASWRIVAHTSDYLTALLGHGIGGGLNPNPTSVKAVFTLNEPIQNITGIRLIGTDGGAASGGFIGVFELAVHSQGASATDTDSDGMDDAWERQNGLDVGSNDSAADPDNDGLTNLQEFAAGTDPKNADTDGDGLTDGAEVNQHKTDPRQADTDGDGLSDGHEVTTTKTDPANADTDGDGFSDPAELNQGSNPNSAASVPTDVALLGTGIIGTKEMVEAGLETAVFNAGVAAHINDGNPATRVDTYNGAGADTASFVGILWDRPVTNPIVRLELSLAVFFDGGWFGVNNVGPGSGGQLSASEHLLEPVVQVSTDRGASWRSVAATSDYLQALNSHPLPDADFGPPTLAKATFQLTQPQSGIDGIRLLGSEGGTASGGFLGVFELAVHTSGSTASEGVELQRAALQSGRLVFEFDSRAGNRYVVEHATSLENPTWETLTTITGDDSRKQVSDPTTGSRRFYRVAALPIPIP